MQSDLDQIDKLFNEKVAKPLNEIEEGNNESSLKKDKD